MFCGRLVVALPLTSLLLLAACGGSTPPFSGERVAAPILSVPLDTAPHLALARIATSCSQTNKLYLIDNKYVFWNLTGICSEGGGSDSSNSYKLMGADPQNLLCETKGHPGNMTRRCSDVGASATMEIIVNNLDDPKLGLGSGHTVAPIEVLAPAGTSVPVQFVLASSVSGVTRAKNVVVKDAASLASLWNEHTAGMSPRPAAPSEIDFTKHVVVALFAGTRWGCPVFGLQRVTIAGHTMANLGDGPLVEYLDRGDITTADCLPNVSTPMQMFLVPATRRDVEIRSFEADIVEFSTLYSTNTDTAFTLVGSPLLSRNNLVVMDQESLEREWAQRYSTLTKPVVDFRSHMVVAVFSGGGDGCYRESIGNISREGGSLIVNSVGSYPLGALCTQSITVSAQWIVIPKSTAPVKFTKQMYYYRQADSLTRPN